MLALGSSPTYYNCDNADYGMRKGKKNENFGKWMRCAKLAIAWNNSEIARSSIFNTENRRYWQVAA